MATIETIRFKLREGVRESDFVTFNREVQTEYMELQPGFISRESSLSDDGEWLVVVHWASDEDATATINAFYGAPQAQAFLGAVDVDTVVSARYHLVELS